MGETCVPVAHASHFYFMPSGVGQAWTTVYAKLHGTGLGVAGGE